MIKNIGFAIFLFLMKHKLTMTFFGVHNLLTPPEIY